jgi:hypothetical protein
MRNHHRPAYLQPGAKRVPILEATIEYGRYRNNIIANNSLISDHWHQWRRTTPTKEADYRNHGGQEYFIQGNMTSPAHNITTNKKVITCLGLGNNTVGVYTHIDLLL